MVNNAIQEFTASIPQYKLLLTARLQTIFALVKEYQLPINISQEDILSKFDPSAVMNLVSRLLLGFQACYLIFCFIFSSDFHVVRITYGEI
ncbi:membrane protein [Actinobacillus equuli]|nr:membrane protein [Actinobacillus equuli]